jgi:hypothetical protein
MYSTLAAVVLVFFQVAIDAMKKAMTHRLIHPISGVPQGPCMQGHARVILRSRTATA